MYFQAKCKTPGSNGICTINDRTKSTSSTYIWVLLGISYSGTSTKDAMASLSAHNPFSRDYVGCHWPLWTVNTRHLIEEDRETNSWVSKLYLSLWTKMNTALLVRYFSIQMQCYIFWVCLYVDL